MFWLPVVIGGVRVRWMLTKIKVRVIPNARRSELVGISQNEVRLKVQAPAQEGKANVEVIRLLRALIDCRKSQITIIQGGRSRNKIVEITGVSPEEIWRKLELEQKRANP
jgi:uncharacterized protein (TIGR00251 family)